MSSLFPIRSDTSPGTQDPRVVDLEGEEAEEVFSALSSETARRIVTALHEEPRTQSDLADDVDTTVQNVRYHLDKLEEAGLVEVVDTWYSSRGNEMAVYAPADGALIVSGDRGRATRLKDALSRLVGGVTVIGLASLLVQTLATRLGRPFAIGAGGGDDLESVDSGDGGGAASGGDNATEYAMNDGTTDGALRTASGGTESTTAADAATETTVADATTETTVAETATETTMTDTATRTATETAAPSATPTPTATPKPTPTATPEPTPTATPTETTTATDGGVEVSTTAADTVATTAAGDAGGAAASGLPPGLLFFLGGVSVLVVLVGVWYWSGS